MSEENIEFAESEVVENNDIVESEVSESESNENNESESHEEQKEVERPWKKKEPESIPYNRFREVNEERKELERRLSEYESRLKSFEETKAKVSEINSIEDLNAKMSELSIEEYNSHLITLARKQFEQEQEKRQEQERIQKFEKDLNDNFVAKIEKSSKSNPEIREAVDYLGQYATRIPPQTRYALLTDDNAGEVIFEIATTPDLLNFVMTANPIDVARKIAKLSSKYDNVSQNSTNETVQAYVPKSSLSPKTSQASPAPGKRKYSDAEIAKMSSADYRKAKADGRI